LEAKDTFPAVAARFAGLLERKSLRVFISGATGFVGHHLTDFLSSSEYTIYGTSFPHPPPPSEKNIYFLDIREEEAVFRAIEKTKPHWIFHFAAVSNVRHSWEMRKETLETNLMGTFFFFEAVRKHCPQSRILFISSSDIYGGMTLEEEPLKEEDSFQVLSPYSFSKVSGELLSRFYNQVEELDVVIARSFPHTGPGQNPDFVCSDWARQIARIEENLSQPVIRVGNIEVKRDFSDVRDVVQAYFLLLKKGKRGEVYNVCSEKAVSLKEILDILLSNSSPGIAVEADPRKFRKADISLLVGNSQKIRKDTGWKPEIPLEKTLLDLLEYWRKKTKSENS
jgi:GDP-4-dehydro-6-deoxy-D-mannose reductase